MTFARNLRIVPRFTKLDSNTVDPRGYSVPSHPRAIEFSTYVCMYGHTLSKSMDQPGKVANPARGQLNNENNIPLSPCVPKNLVSRDEFSRPVPRQPAHLHTEAEPGAYLRDSSRVPRRRPFMKPPYAIGSVPSLSGRVNCVLMAFTAESPPAQGQLTSR